MAIEEALREIREKQQRVIQDCEQLLRDVHHSDTLRENAELKVQVADTKAKLEQLETECRRLSQDNCQLNSSLREQIIDEKLSILKISQRKMNTYFQTADKEQANRLTELKERIQRELAGLKKAAFQVADAERDIYLRELVLHPVGL